MTTTTEATAEAKRTVTLTGRRPVTIVESEWPTIADARDGVEMRNGTPLPDYERASWLLRVRKHADGSAIVYGVAKAPNAGWPDHGASDWRGGELLEAGHSDADMVAAIERVGQSLVEDGGAPEDIIHRCIADLPAEAL